MNHPSPFEHMLLPDDPHDQRLIENCHPPRHINPQPSGKYNLVAIGAGTAGLVCAGGAGGLGAKAALIERSLMGGDCLNTGCVPSKAIIRAARAAYDTHHAHEFGIHLSAAPQIHFAEVMKRMRRLRAQISSNDSVRRFQNEFKADVFMGNARFVSPTAIEVDGQRLEFDRAVIATGGRPAELLVAGLPIAGLKEAGYYTNENIFTLTELPRRMAVIGAGPIGCELAQSFARFGSTVTLLTDSSHILPREDADAAALVQHQFISEGVQLVTNAQLERVELRNGERVISYKRAGQTDQTEMLTCDAILVAAGRSPNLEGLHLEAANVAYDHNGVIVNDHWRTSNKRIYAAGDVCSKHKFTHAAEAAARGVLRNALFFGNAKASQLVMPWVTYTDPEIAHVGLYESDAQAAGFNVATVTQHFDDVDRAILDGESEGLARAHYDCKSGKILGATIVARHAGEMLGELTLAITHGLKMSALSATIHPYPTQADALRKLGDAYNKTRLTPTVKKFFGQWFAWRR